MAKSKTDHWFKWLLQNTAVGILLGFILGILLASVIDAEVLPGIKEFYSFIISAILGMIAAALTLIGVFATISHQRESERLARRRRLEAARAFLPSALSRMCEISNQAMRFSFEFNDFESRLGEDGFRDHSMSALVLTDEIISVFRDVIELTGDDSVSRRLSGLLREHQVFLARWRSIFSPDRAIMIQIPSDVRQRTVSWAYLGAISSSLFAFARSETETIETTVGYEEISSALNTAGLINLHTEDHSEEIGLYARTFSRRFT